MKKRFEKSTRELQDILNEAGRKNALEQYLKDIKAADGELVLCDYLNETIAKKGLALSDVVKNSGFDKGYVYNIFNGARTNPDRKKLIGICLGSHMTFAETQRTLEIAGKGICTRATRRTPSSFSTSTRRTGPSSISTSSCMSTDWR